MTYDVALLGAGITGSSLAFELSKYKLNVILIERENDVAMKTTKANSGIVHAGYDPLPGTKMARLNVEGCKLIHDLHPLLNFHYKQIGSLVIGSTDEDHRKIDTLYERGIQNGVPELRILKGKEEVHQMEPHLNEEIDYALYAPTCGVVSPWELALSLAETAVINGVEFAPDHKVEDIIQDGEEYLIKTSKGDIRARYVVNCAGVFADDLYRIALKDKKDASFDITPCVGEYYLLDREEGNVANHVLFQCPNHLGKGVLVSPTVHGNLIVGPDASYDMPVKDYTGNTQKGLDFVRAASQRTIKNVNFRNNIRNFAGVRATIQGKDDFLIEESPYLKHFINFAGIKSPGLTSGPAFGKELVRMLEADGEKIEKKEEFKYYRLPDFFHELSMEEKQELIKKDSRYGQIICRCETVTEGEIVHAIHQPIPATTIDGVKRRTNAGMGRCQGGFCGPKVFEILKRELNLEFDEVYQDVTGSKVVVEKTKGEK